MVSTCEMRFVGALFLTFLFSLNKPGIKLNILQAITVCFTAYGTIHLILQICLIMGNLLALRFYRNIKLAFVMNLLILYAYRYSNIQKSGTYDITGFLMIFIIKMCYVTKYYDGDFTKILQYILFVPGLITGPVALYEEFKNLYYNKGKQNKAYTSKDTLRDFPRIMLVACLYSFAPKEYLLDKIRFGSFLPFQLFYLTIYNIVNRCKFYFAWYFADVCFKLMGFHGYLNILWRNVELTESVKELAANWNKFMSRFLKEFVFLEMTKKYSKFISALAVYVVSSLLHSYEISVLIFFISFAISNYLINVANNFVKSRICRIIQMSLFISYFSLPFYLRDTKKTFEIWSSIHFYMQIYLLIMFLILQLGSIIKKLIKSK
ncbi:hypothetical protein NUSPORA_00547 [Nucleospora cyclopteri]